MDLIPRKSEPWNAARLTSLFGVLALLSAMAVLAHCMGKTMWSNPDDRASANANKAGRPSVADRVDSGPGLRGETLGRRDESDQPPSWEEVTRRCYELNDGTTEGRLSPDCMSTLDAWFLDRSVTPSVLPNPDPVHWRHVFNGIPQRVEIVRAALADESCFVPWGDIRYELGERCGARAMVELQVAMDVCSNVDDEDTYRAAIDDWGHLSWGVDHYLSRVWPLHWQRAVENLDRSSIDQSSYWDGLRRLLNGRYRTEWTLARCFSVVSELPNRGNSSTLPPLMPLAARYGDTFAIANYPDMADPNLDRDQSHLARLLDRNPLQAFVHYARAYPVWAKQLSRRLGAGERAEIDNALRDLLGADLKGDATPQAIRTMLRRRSEFLRLKYMLAAKFLAERMDVEMDSGTLNTFLRIVEPNLLDGNDLNLAQFEAEQLVTSYAPR